PPHSALDERFIGSFPKILRIRIRGFHMLVLTIGDDFDGRAYGCALWSCILRVG
ncbi:hypothetical protein HAX54_052688, partial [Datura stramonium]|nr:hypothetical protein [Datura stramonium]